jgi:anti-sigma factor RsiW
VSHTVLPDVPTPCISASVACPVSEERMHGLLDDELPSGEADALRRHLARCAPCRRRVSSLARLLAAVRRQRLYAAVAPPALRDRVRALGRP